MNAEKQEEVIGNMLDKIVGMYDDAYSAIRDIIKDTGIVGTPDFNEGIKDIGTSGGASDTANSATKPQDKIKPGDTTTGINTGNVGGSDTSKIEEEIGKEPNTKNRPVSEIILSKKSITLEEGKSTSITANIRPTDAKNKALKWSSSEPSKVSVSGGTIKALKPGSAQITATAIDGGGASSKPCTVTVTAKPKPPPPKPKPKPPTSTQGDGIIQVGDKVRFDSGQFFVDSYGSAPLGSRYRGTEVYITKINPKGSRPYHISRGNKLGSSDLGWLKSNQISGYATGARRINKDGYAFTDDTLSGKANPGSEVVMTDRGTLQYLNQGDTVFDEAQRQNLWDISKGKLNNMLPSPTAGVNAYNVEAKDNSYNVVVNFDNLISVEGNATPETIKVADRDLPELAGKLGVLMRKELRRM